MKPTLAVDLGGLRLPTPVMIASGCFSAPKDVSGLVDLRKVGGIVLPSVTMRPRRGSPTPRMAETSSGLLSSIGLQNPGVDAALASLPGLAKIGVPLFASVAGASVEEYLRVAAAFASVGTVAGLELNLSCPNDERGGRFFASDADQAAAAVAAVTGVARVPVLAKLSSETSDVVEVAKSCMSAGARGVTLINTVTGIAIDARTHRPKLASGTGGLSGPAIKPISLLAVYRVAQGLPDVPIVGVGGVTTAEDAVEYIAAGATAVQVGTAMFVDPAAPVEIAIGIGRHLMECGLPDPEALRGTAHGPAAPEPSEEGS
ncbi:MAG: dihydroorotate dehydrogenase [Actinomycetota bacterium]